jgi:hypothetical protein
MREALTFSRQGLPKLFKLFSFLIIARFLKISQVKKGAIMLKLNFDGQELEVAFQHRSLKKPATRLIQAKPFKHVSSLFPVLMDDGKKIFLFDSIGQGYIWDDLNNPRGFKPITSELYLKLKRKWYIQNRKEFLAEKKPC